MGGVVFGSLHIECLRGRSVSCHVSISIFLCNRQREEIHTYYVIRNKPRSHDAQNFLSNHVHFAGSLPDTTLSHCVRFAHSAVSFEIVPSITHTRNPHTRSPHLGSHKKKTFKFQLSLDSFQWDGSTLQFPQQTQNTTPDHSSTITQ